MTLVRLNKSQLQAICRAEGCDCTDKQWEKRGNACSIHWIRCRGRFAWKKKNDEKFRKALESL